MKVSLDIFAGREAPLNLAQAILLYEGDHGVCFASVHGIDASGKQPVILEGRAFTLEAAVRLALELSSNAMSGGFVPPELLYLDGNAMAWWVPPARRHIAFRSEKLGAPERGEVVPHPGLVFRAEHFDRSIGALDPIDAAFAIVAAGQPGGRDLAPV